MHIIFPLTWAAWILFELVIGFSKGSKAEDRKNLDRHTLICSSRDSRARI